MKPERNDWAVISGGKDFSYSLVCFKNEKDFYWGQTSSFCTMLEEYKIVEIIGKVPSSKWDDMEIAYVKKYQPIKSSDVKESAGWLAPDGKFYTCSYGGHRSLSIKLSCHYYDQIEDSTKILEEKGWIKVYKNGVIGWDESKELENFITKKQKSTLSDLILIDGSEEWNSRMNYWAKYTE